MVFSVRIICCSIFVCHSVIAKLSYFTPENLAKDVKCTGELIGSCSHAYEQGYEEENNRDSGQHRLTSSGYLNSTLSQLPFVQSSLSMSRAFDSSNQMLLAIVDFILARTEGRHFFLLHDQQFEDIEDPMTRLIQREGDIAVFKCDSDPVELETMIRGYFHVDPLRNIFVLCSSQNTVNLFKQITSKALESRSVHWFVILKENIATNISKIIKEGTQISAAVAVGNRFKFMNSYIKKDDKIAFSEAGWWQWHPPKGLSSTTTTTTKGTFTFSLKQPLYRPLDEVYSDFGGRVMRSAVIDNLLFFNVHLLPNGTALPRSGIDFNVLNTLAANLNFSYELVLTEDKQWGSLQPDGTFSGMIGKVEKGHAHFAINEITIDPFREDVVDFTSPYFMESTTLICPAPKEKSRAFAVFSPFTIEVWLTIAVVTLVMGPIITAVTWFHYEFDRDNTKLYTTTTFSFTTFRSLVNQGNLLNVQCFYQRSFFMAWFFYCLLIYALYAGNLTAVLTVPTYEEPIDSLWDLLTAIQVDGYELIVARGSSVEFTFKDAKGGIYKQLWQLFTPENSIPRMDAYGKVLTGKFVYIAAKLGAIIRTKRIGGLQNYYFAKNTFLPQNYGIACTSGAPYIDIFGTLLTRMFSAGLINKWTDDGLAKEKNRLVEGSKSSGAISLVHLQAAFFILLIGNFVALSILIMEYLFNTYHTNHKKDH